MNNTAMRDSGTASGRWSSEQQLMILIIILKIPGTHGIRMRNCFAFSMRNHTVDLLDKRGYVRNAS